MLAPISPLGPTIGPEVDPTPDSVPNAASRFADILANAEAQAAGALTGETGTRQAVDAVMEAERTMRTAVAVRDKLVAAWLDLSRMSI